MNALELERQSLELQLEEIQVKRKLNDLDLRMLHAEIPKPLVEMSDNVGSHLHLHYSKSAMDSVMRVATVNADGSIGIFGKYDSILISKQYNVQSLKWICKKLPDWSKRQRVEKRFFENIAGVYSKKFAKLSDVTMEKLCYLVDSGKFDYWFEKYEGMKPRQVTLGV